MAAALGYAARRLDGGAVRQTQAAAFSLFPPAVEVEQRRLFPRFIHTEGASNLPGKEGALKNIKKKTEELYELILKAEREYGYDLGVSKTTQMLPMGVITRHRSGGKPKTNNCIHYNSVHMHCCIAKKTPLRTHEQPLQA